MALTKNIFVTTAGYDNENVKKYTQYIPQVVYVDGRSAKSSISYRQDLADDHTIAFGFNSTAPTQDTPLFQIYPLGVDQGMITSLSDYTSLSEQDLKDYPTMTLNPSGRLISSPIYLDKYSSFLKNTLSFEKSTENTAKWTPSGGYIEIPETGTVDLYPEKYTKDFEVNANNFGNCNNITINNSQTPFKIIKAIDKPVYGQACKDTKKKHSRRIYNLTPTQSMFPTNNQSFYFAIKTNSLKQAAVYIDWGFNRVDITKDGVCLSCATSQWFKSNGQIGTDGGGGGGGGSNTGDSGNSGSNNNSGGGAKRRRVLLADNGGAAPSFIQNNASQDLKNCVSFIVYPVGAGMAIQPGIDMDVLSPAENTGLKKGKGSFCQLYLTQNQKAFNPSLNEWYSNNKTGAVTGSIKQAITATVSGGNINLILNNCVANFFYMPLYFLAYSRFRLYFKGAVGDEDDRDAENFEQKSVDKHLTISGGGKGDRYSRVSYKGTVIYSFSGVLEAGNFITSVQAYTARPEGTIKTDAAGNQQTIPPSSNNYYFDFVIDARNVYSTSVMPFPIEIIAVVILQKNEMAKSIYKTDHGRFGGPTVVAGSISQCVTWQQAIQQVSVNWSEEGGSGQIVVDRYAIQGGEQQTLFPQEIGGISIAVNAPWNSGKIFTGFVTKTTFNSSFSADTATFCLQGLQRKLTDLKIVNAPYFDGDLVTDISSFFSCFCGIEMVEYQISNMRIGVSELFGKPFLDFKQGTTSLEAMQQAANAGSFRVVLQPEGKCWFVKENQATGLPEIVTTSTANVVLSAANIISFSVQPALNNLYNFVVVAAFKPVKAGTQQIMNGGITASFPGHITQRDLYDETTPKVPWSRLFVQVLNAQIDNVQLDTYVNRVAAKAKFYFLMVNVTSLGYGNVLIYQSVSFLNKPYFVLSISHNVDCVTKKWTTTLSLQQVK